MSIKKSNIVVLIPCLNEEITIGKVIRDFQKSIPEAQIIVFDNNSTDRTASVAYKSGAKVEKELLEGNLRFVISVAKDYQNQGIELSDLIAEGNLGLLKAINNFDWNKGFRFISYAVWWVKQAILQSLNDNSRTVRLPANMINKLAKIKKEIEKFEMENERSPSLNEVEQVHVPKVSSLNVSVNEDGDELGSLIEDDIFGRPDEINDKDILSVSNIH